MKTIITTIYPAFALFAFAWFALSPQARAVDPAPDGGYPNGNTAEGDNALFSLTTGFNNTAIGDHALYSNTDGAGNSAFGFGALQSNTGINNTATGGSALTSNTTGSANTANGVQSLYVNTEGSENVANGLFSLQSNTTGNGNTATGTSALLSNTAGSFNTANGYQALFNNAVDDSTAVGAFALYSNTTGDHNTAVGFSALYSNTTGTRNTATGFQALYSNTTGRSNTAVGRDALANNTTGDDNTANGFNALFSNTTGVHNTGIGEFALASNTTGTNNTANGRNSLASNTIGFGNAAFGNATLYNSTGSLNIALGLGAGINLSSGDNNITIGNIGVAAEGNAIRIGQVVAGTDQFGQVHPAHTATYIAGIMGKTVARGTPVFISANGQLGTTTSSARFKDEIKPMDKASEAILALKPVTFRYKKEIDAEGTPQFGLVAEDVEKVNPELVLREADGKVYTVRYEAVNAMLLNEFLKAHRKIEEQGSMIAQQQRQIEALTVGLQKVSAQLELSKAAPQTVLNDQ
jgi:trimeric autotransporter adhesin